jgi:translation initiation factor 5A
MSDDEFETADAGAEGCTPVSVGSVKKGGYVVIKGFPCKVADYSTAKTGKHGSAKAMYVGIDIFTGRKYEDSKPTSATTLEPNVTRTEYQIIDINDEDSNEVGAIASLLDLETGETVDDLRVPTDAEYNALREAVKASDASGKDVLVSVLEAMGQRKILSQFVLK